MLKIFPCLLFVLLQYGVHLSSVIRGANTEQNACIFLKSNLAVSFKSTIKVLLFNIHSTLQPTIFCYEPQKQPFSSLKKVLLKFRIESERARIHISKVTLWSKGSPDVIPRKLIRTELKVKHMRPCFIYLLGLGSSPSITMQNWSIV